MANKKYTEFPAGSYVDTRVLLTADPSSGELQKIDVGAIQGSPVSSSLRAYQALGSAAIGETVGGTISILTGSVGLPGQQATFIPIWVPLAGTITGAKWLQLTQGVYTASNYNGIGLYTYNAGTLTLVASSTDDGNIWKGASGTWQSKAFTSPYSATQGLYFICLLYNNSAQTTAPAFSRLANANSNAMTFDFTNSAKLFAVLSGATSLPSPTQTMSGISNSGIYTYYIALY